MYFVPDEGYAESNCTLPSFSGSENYEFPFQNYGFIDDPNYSFYLSPYPNGNGDISEIPDFPDACLKYISDILMEEDSNDGLASSLQENGALQATEKSLYDALGETSPPSAGQWPVSVGLNSDDFSRSCSDQWGNSYYAAANMTAVESKSDLQTKYGHSELVELYEDPPRSLETASLSSLSSSSFEYFREGLADSPISTLRSNETNNMGSVDLVRGASNCILKEDLRMNLGQWYKEKSNQEEEKVVGLISVSRGRKNHQRENYGELEERSNKQFAADNEDYVEMEKFDDVLICKEGSDDISICTTKSAIKETEEGLQEDGKSRRSRSRKNSRGKKKSNRGEVVDLRTILTQCAQSVASFELTNANELLHQIKQHANPLGDSVQRVAHYFVKGIEARLAGTGSEKYKGSSESRVSPYDSLKAYRLYCSAIPFQRTTYYLANQTIAKLAAKATRIHIIDFGIFLGFQWPCLIQHLSQRPLGPPVLRITGVDHPISGFRPTQLIDQTGRRLAGYCQRFGVPFEFHAIAKPWHTIQPRDFKIERGELVVVNCLYQTRKIPDESVDSNCPRNSFLNLIRSLNPDLFIHGIVNGTFNAPFFLTRFREALYHYSCLFDVFEATIPREDHERLLIEKYLYGEGILNIVACEGAARVERPETYKQWQVRKQRAGFKQVPLEPEIVNRAKATVKANYHKEFMVEQDKHWMVQGWKGRILSAISCWKPAA